MPFMSSSYAIHDHAKSVPRKRYKDTLEWSMITAGIDPHSWIEKVKFDVE